MFPLPPMLKDMDTIYFINDLFIPKSRYKLPLLYNLVTKKRMETFNTKMFLYFIEHHLL